MPRYQSLAFAFHLAFIVIAHFFFLGQMQVSGNLMPCSTNKSFAKWPHASECLTRSSTACSLSIQLTTGTSTSWLTTGVTAHSTGHQGGIPRPSTRPSGEQPKPVALVFTFSKQFSLAVYLNHSCRPRQDLVPALICCLAARLATLPVSLPCLLSSPLLSFPAVSLAVSLPCLPSPCLLH